ncbi:YihY/virulence factor BrkB family protein [Candidatus Methylobacter oryzae]|uniref:YihY/virulence factor BrkB family protein n=1 Tax=Candidatus Methylobacter oryzae TaxID=2497749 RepID=A0ABY3C6L4_9GAMM|nr:YihY/virulence factor BrkB family protein [Candidatus Methylobacter oryzae]TRW91244.1 YihY/virulence factor BrkB family protein [Candidatus Methylobacter oryzae]
MELNISNSIKKYIWGLRDDKLPPFKEKAIKSLKILVLSAQGFSRDLCSLRASALTLYTLLSIVPVIAMLFGIAKGFGLEKMLKQRLLEQIPNQETMVLKLIGFAQNLLDNAQGEVVAGTGIVILFWTIINVISDIEQSFNYIWKVSQDRSLSRKFSDYLSLMLLAPIVLIVSGSITVFLKTQLTWLVNILYLPAIGEWFVIRALSLLPLLLMTGLFAFIFIFMPNRKINYQAGIIAGLVTAIMYTLTQWAYLSLQIGVSSYNAIYGSFAALPLFVVWLQVGWMITLFGCEIAFFTQNFENYQEDSDFSNLSFSLKKIIALQVIHLIVKNFIPLNNPLTAAQIAAKLAMPIAIVQSVLLMLIASRIVIELKNREEYEVYQPAADVNKLTIAYVINALEQCGQNQLPGLNQDQLFSNAVNDFKKLIESSGQDRLLKDI